ncbi:MAG: YidC/Oxa1 family membrane protein insertase [Eubacterium sp.]|nr:YidC/Oxa1 family membrane protein insertase [Eubacterium sp.]
MLLFLSKSTMPILGWIAELLGWVMNGIYVVLEKVGIQNIALCIIIYTIIVYLIMTPIQVKQQKLMKVQGLIQPELREIQKKYMGRRDTESQQKLNNETMAVYDKYGVSPTGSCLPSIIQLLLLFSVYQVIYHIPGYIHKVGSIFTGLADKLYTTTGGVAAITNFIETNQLNRTLQNYVAGNLTRTNIVDLLYMLSPRQWTVFQSIPAFSGFSAEMAEVAVKGQKISSFLGMHISESTINTIKNGAAEGQYLIVFLAIMIPVLAFLTQWINMKLTPGAANSSNSSDQMASTMKMMNYFMPILSVIFCFSLSIGVGVYWIAGAVVRSVQQVIINRSMMKLNVDKIVEDNISKKQEKAARARERDKKHTDNINERATQYVPRTTITKYTNDGREIDYYSASKDADPNSLTAKANMVRRLQEQKKNKKKK